MLLRPLLLAILLLAAAPALTTPAHAQDYECDKPNSLERANGDLALVLARHKEWLSMPWREQDLNDERRANLCDADLHGDMLAKAAQQAGLREVNLANAVLNGASLFEAKLNGAVLNVAELNGADLTNAKLFGADLRGAELNGAHLGQANLNGANLSEAKLNCLSPDAPNLEERKCAILQDTDLSDANLFRAELIGAHLVRTVLAGSKFSYAKIGGALFEPASAPDKGHVSGIEGIPSVRFREGRHSGLVQLRDALKEAGLRDEEREATFALESRKTDFLLGLSVDDPSNVLEEFLGVSTWNDVWADRSEWARENPLDTAAGLFRLVFFEWTSDWGRDPGRPLLILLVLFVIFWPFYMLAVIHPITKHAGIWKVWSKDRVIGHGVERKPEKIVNLRWWALLWGIYFSLISAFHIGWRDLNVGSWIARIHPGDYSLRATGWVKTLSGVQSLISVYLIAIWALTYFGRPFG